MLQTKPLSHDELIAAVTALETVWSDGYGYTLDPNAEIRQFAFFRNRDESFDRDNPPILLHWAG